MLDNSAGYLDTYQSTSQNYVSDVQNVEKELNLKKKIVELETKLEKLLQKTTSKPNETENERLTALGNKFKV